MAKKVIKDKKEKAKSYDANKEYIKSVDISQIIIAQHAEYETAKGARETWENKQVKWYKKRYGIRKDATFPWLGASNGHIPTGDNAIRKTKPEYVAVAWNTMPLSELYPAPIGNDDPLTSDKCDMLGWHFDYLLRNRMKAFPQIVLLTDKMLGKGMSIGKAVYETRYESRIVKFSKEEILDTARQNAVSPEDMDLLDNPAKSEQLFEMLTSNFQLDPVEDKIKVQSIMDALYAGNEAVEFSTEILVYDAPKIIALDPEDVVVPADTLSIFDLEQARWIDHRYQISPAELLAGKLSGKWNGTVVDMILEKRGIHQDDIKGTAKLMVNNKAGKEDEQRTSLMAMTKAQREGISDQDETNMITIHERCMWYDADGDGLEERHVLDYCEEFMLDCLRFMKYPYEMAKWCYVKFPFELTDGRHYSNRGLIEITNPMASAINVQHNAKINRQTIATSPTLLYAPGKVNPDNFRFIPGRATPVASPVNQNAMWMTPPVQNDDTFDREVAYLKGTIDDFIGSVDAGTTAPTGKASNTATLTNYQQMGRVSVRQLDMEIFQFALKELYERIWELWRQFSPEEIWTYTDSSGKLTKIKKTELAGNVGFAPSGRFGTTDPVLEAQKSRSRLEMFANDPYFLPYELRRDLVMKDDPRLFRRIMKPKGQAEEEMAQQAQQQMQLQMADMQMKAKQAEDELKLKLLELELKYQTKPQDLKVPSLSGAPTSKADASATPPPTPGVAQQTPPIESKTEITGSSGAPGEPKTGQIGAK